MVYACSSLIQLAPGLRDLSNTEKIITVFVKLIKFTQNDDFVHPGQFCMPICGFALL